MRISDPDQARAIKEYTKLAGKPPLGSPKEYKDRQVNIRLNQKDWRKLEKVTALALASINTNFQLGNDMITLEDVTPRKYQITKASVARHLISKAVNKLISDEELLSD